MDTTTSIVVFIIFVGILFAGFFIARIAWEQKKMPSQNIHSPTVTSGQEAQTQAPLQSKNPDTLVGISNRSSQLSSNQRIHDQNVLVGTANNLPAILAELRKIREECEKTKWAARSVALLIAILLIFGAVIKIG